MIWKPCKLLHPVETGKDELGNAIVSWETVKETRARFTPWTDEQIALEGRDVTQNEQRFAVPIPFDKFPPCEVAEIDGVRNQITQTIDLCPRYTVLQVKSFKR